MNKQELKQENEELLFELRELNRENKQLKQAIEDLELKKYSIKHACSSVEVAQKIYNWLTENLNQVGDVEEQRQLWNEFLGMISWKFIPRENGEMELDLNLVYENELKGKYKLVKL